jgi:hypothetical protein
MCKLTYYFRRSSDLVICFAKEKISSIVEFMRPGQDLPGPVMTMLARFPAAFATDIPTWKNARDSIIRPVYDYLKKKFSDVKPIPTAAGPKRKP